MILAGDIGGTNARIAFFEVEQRRLKCIYEHVYPTHEHPNLESAVATFIGEYRVKPEAACFGIAGPVTGGRCAQMPNLKWVVEADKLEREIGIETVTLVNDLEANAYGVSALEPTDFAILNEGRADASGNQAVIAAGTGLGEAGLYWDGKTHRPFACEGGHVDFGPGDELQTEMLIYLRHEFGHVSWERVIAGPGLFNVYRFLRDTHRGEEPAWLKQELAHDDPSVRIARLGLENKSELCVRALEVFASMYGAEAGNLALKLMATGGIFIGEWNCTEDSPQASRGRIHSRVRAQGAVGVPPATHSGARNFERQVRASRRSARSGNACITSSLAQARRRSSGAANYAA